MKGKTWVKNSAQNEVILSFNENVRNMKCLPNDTGKRPTNESTHSSSNYRNLERWKEQNSHILFRDDGIVVVLLWKTLQFY